MSETVGTRVVRRRNLSMVLGVLLTLAALTAGVVMVITAVRPSGPTPAPVPEESFTNAQVADPDVPSALPSVAQGGDPEVAAHSEPSHQARAAEPSQVPAGPITDGHLVIPAISVDTVVTDYAQNPDGSLILPQDVNRVARWSGSATVADKTGTVLVAGHVDNINQGLGALYYLYTLKAGDAVYLAEKGIVTRWKVVALKAFQKAQLPTDVWAGTSGERRLVLVTCGGELVNGSYTDNVVLTAVPF